MMLLKILNLVPLSFILLMLVACYDASIPLDEKGREDFRHFYAQFETDSLFQMKRIEFPMIGQNPNGSKERFFWNEENWVVQKKINPDNDEIHMQPFLDMGDLMRVRMLIQQKFMIENLFSLINNKWFLTEYSGVHDIEYFKKGKK